jgi:hypothetical protein
MQIWLILAVVGTAPIHVGNFPGHGHLPGCGNVESGPGDGRAPRKHAYLWMCVQANTGKPNDPPPPP